MKKTLIVMAVLAAAFGGIALAQAANLGAGAVNLSGKSFVGSAAIVPGSSFGAFGSGVNPGQFEISKEQLCQDQCTVVKPDGLKVVDIACYKECLEKEEALPVIVGGSVGVVGGFDIGNRPGLTPGTDTDGDGVIDSTDNCFDVVNADQADSDSNGVGDACQDTDADGILDVNDRCPTEVEIMDVKSMLSVDGSMRDGCPDSLDEGKGDSEDTLTTAASPVLGGDGGCSLAGNAAANPLIFLLLGMALLPLARRRKE